MAVNRSLLIAAGALCATLASGAIALPPESQSGEPVDNIPQAHQILDWQPLDDQHVLVNLPSQNAYLLTLKHQCFGLSWAQNITVTMSNNTIWAGFDAIKADGLQCPIDRISKMSAKDILRLEAP